VFSIQYSESEKPMNTGNPGVYRKRPPEKLPFARSFKELVVYSKARALSRAVFQISKRFPKEEAYSLTSQWRRAARSIGAQIAEAWAKRRYAAHFVSKLTDAAGEQQETQHWTITALDDGYISRDEAQEKGSLAVEIGRILGDMIQNAESFRGEDHILKESGVEYFVDGSELNTEY
jgi:four helix bundle protein